MATDAGIDTPTVPNGGTAVLAAARDIVRKAGISDTVHRPATEPTHAMKSSYVARQRLAGWEIERSSNHDQWIADQSSARGA